MASAACAWMWAGGAAAAAHQVEVAGALEPIRCGYGALGHLGPRPDSYPAQRTGQTGIVGADMGPAGCGTALTHWRKLKSGPSATAPRPKRRPVGRGEGSGRRPGGSMARVVVRSTRGVRYAGDHHQAVAVTQPSNTRSTRGGGRP